MLIFLDIDGVMTPIKGWSRPRILEDGFPAFSDKAVNAIRKVLTKNQNVRIVLTTSHKGNYSRQQWIKIFLNRGIDHQNLDKLNNNSTNLSRREEILSWLAEHNLNDDEAIMIIDDDKSLFDLPAALKLKLVNTSPMIGLTEELVP
jgi:putative lipoic acid-binding regulatory protein